MIVGVELVSAHFHDRFRRRVETRSTPTISFDSGCSMEEDRACDLRGRAQRLAGVFALDEIVFLLAAHQEVLDRLRRDRAIEVVALAVAVAEDAGARD